MPGPLNGRVAGRNGSNDATDAGINHQIVQEIGTPWSICDEYQVDAVLFAGHKLLPIDQYRPLNRPLDCAHRAINALYIPYKAESVPILHLMENSSKTSNKSCICIGYELK